MEFRLAKRMSEIKASEIREILKVTESPEVISFAGGLPAPELFPVNEIKEVNRIVLEESGTKALQYTTTEGYGGLFAWVELPTHINAREVLEKSLEQNIAFVPGGSFFPNGSKENTFN